MPNNENDFSVEAVEQKVDTMSDGQDLLLDFDGKLQDLTSDRNVNEANEATVSQVESKPSVSKTASGNTAKKSYKAPPSKTTANKPQARKPKENLDNEESGNQEVSVSLSRSLINKLKRLSKSEGVSLEAMIIELVSEGTVLRAWEIVERKNHLRDANSNVSNGNGYNNRRNNNNRQDSNGRHHNNKNNGHNPRSMNKNRYNSIMDDKANFLEYVRNQEKYNR